MWILHLVAMITMSKYFKKWIQVFIASYKTVSGQKCEYSYLSIVVFIFYFLGYKWNMCASFLNDCLVQKMIRRKKEMLMHAFTLLHIIIVATR